MKRIQIDTEGDGSTRDTSLEEANELLERNLVHTCNICPSYHLNKYVQWKQIDDVLKELREEDSPVRDGHDVVEIIMEKEEIRMSLPDGAPPQDDTKKGPFSIRYKEYGEKDCANAHCNKLASTEVDIEHHEHNKTKGWVANRRLKLFLCTNCNLIMAYLCDELGKAGRLI